MNLHILAELDGDDASTYLDEIAREGKSSVFKAMLLSFRVNHRDALEHFPIVEWLFPLPGWETYEEIGYILAWNTRLGSISFWAKGIK